MPQDALDVLPRLLELGGLGVFLWFLVNGLRQQIAALQNTVSTQSETLVAQKQTLEAMQNRVEEAEKVGALYRKLIDDLPHDIEKYREILHHLKDQVIDELRSANERKDSALAELTKSRLDEIDRQEKVLEELPRMRDKLVSTIDSLEARLSVLDLFQPNTPLGEMLHELEALARQRQGRRERPFGLLDAEIEAEIVDAAGVRP